MSKAVALAASPVAGGAIGREARNAATVASGAGIKPGQARHRDQCHWPASKRSMPPESRAARSLRSLNLPPIAAAACVVLSQISRGQPR
jgi:hypothetical protein